MGKGDGGGWGSNDCMVGGKGGTGGGWGRGDGGGWLRGTGRRERGLGRWEKRG